MPRHVRARPRSAARRVSAGTTKKTPGRPCTSSPNLALTLSLFSAQPNQPIMPGADGGKRKASGRDGGGAAASCVAAATVAVVVLLLAASALLFLTPLPPRQARAGPREPVELAMGVAGHEGWLDAVRAWAKLACLRLRPGAGEPAASVKQAAKKSLEMGKEAVEHTAESAARATEEGLGRTTETVRRKVSSSSPRRRDADL